MKNLIRCLLVLIPGFCFMPAVVKSELYELHPDYDVCDPKTAPSINPNSVYLPDVGSSTEVFVNWTYTMSEPSSISCHLYFNTCLNCYIKVETVGNFNYSYCLKKLFDFDDEYTCSPGCINIFLFDVYYKNQTSKTISKFSDIDFYRSESRQLHVIACGLNSNQDIHMRLQLTSMEKFEQLSQSPYGSRSVLFLKSPYFPSPYAKNEESYTYKLEAFTTYQVIVVSFDDWSLSYNSYLEFQGANNVGRVTGKDPRPYIISKGSSMTVTFYTGAPIASSSSFLGFKALIQFYSSFSTIIQPKIDCDRLVSFDGGYITLPTSDGNFRDCIWIIKKMIDYDAVFVKIIKYEHSRYDSSDKSLEIHDGITSETDVILNAKPNDSSINSSGFLSDSGFYIRFRGQFSYGETLVLSYAMVTYDCQNYRGYYKCDNGLCISGTLKCDGYDHCGDNSDELGGLCAVETTHSSGSSSSISIGVIIPLVVSVFLIIIMCLLILFIRRCRRLNNSASRSRAGVRPPQSRGRRHRRHRDVQMSVTLSSGEHPPSYDEVLQNTPIGYLNMAFTWSQHGSALTQPPSYEEAVSPTPAQPNGSVILTAAANSSDPSTNPQQQSSTSVLATTISASLDPRADVSSSSSSEGAIDPYNCLEFSSSSDSSTENERPMIANNCSLDHSRSMTNLTKASKGSDGGVYSHGAPKYGCEDGGAQIVLETPSSQKLNTEIHDGVKSENSRRKEESKSNKSHNVVNGKTESHDRYRGLGEARNVTDDRGVLFPHSSERRQEVRRNEGGNYGLNSSKDFGENDRARRDKNEVYHKHKGQHSECAVDREGTQLRGKGHHKKYDNDDANMWPPKVTDSSRSQSCVDLSWGVGAQGAASRMGLRDDDKRFSYAGAGDVSLERGSLDSFYNGRGLVREKPIEHLDKYASQSSDNLRDGYRAKRHDHRNYEIDGGHDIISRHSADQAAYYPRSRRDRPDLLQPDIKYSGLAPVLESLNDEAYETTKVPDDASRHMPKNVKNAVDGFQKSTSENNKWAEMPNFRSSSLYESGPSLIQSNADQKASSHDARGTIAGHFPLGSTRFQPSDFAPLTPSSLKYYTDDRTKYSQSQNNRQNGEPHSRQNLEIRNDEQNSNSINKITTPSGITDSFSHSPNSTDLLRNSKDSGLVQEHKRISQSNQDRETTAAKPKPTLRTQFQAAQRSDREVLEAIPKPISHLKFRTPQKPTPAPRNVIKKRQDVDASNSEFAPTGNQNYMPDNVSYAGSTQPRSLSAARYPDQTSAQQMAFSGRSRPDSQDVWEPQDTDRWTAGGKEERFSPLPSEQLSSRGQIQVQTTNDDVFV